MNTFNSELSSGQGLAALFNFDTATTAVLTGSSSRLDNETTDDLNSVWSSDASGVGTGFQSAFQPKFPANERNTVTRTVNPCESTVVPIVRYRLGWESALTTGNLAFVLLNAPGANVNSNAVLLATLPVVNWTLQMGQLTDTARTQWVNGDSNGIRYDKAAFNRRFRGFADSTLFGDARPTAGDATRFEFQQYARANLLPTRFALYGVVQQTTGVDSSVVTVGSDPRSSVVVAGYTQTRHLWGAYMPGMRLYFAFVRMLRSVSDGAFLLSGPEGQQAPAQFRNAHTFAQSSYTELHSTPYVIVPCWATTKDGKSRFCFHPQHEAAISAARDANSPIQYVSVGVLIHAPLFRPDVAMQARAAFDGRALDRLPMSTISFSAAPL
jgi:hypothetical protein